MLLFSSCSSSDCTVCEGTVENEKDVPITWNVELKTPEQSKCNGESIMSIKSPFKPKFIPNDSEKDFSCDSGVDWDGHTWEEYIKNKNVSELDGEICVVEGTCDQKNMPIHRIHTGNVEEITMVQNPLLTTDKWTPDEPEICCIRIRNGWLIFDKFEFRAMGGWRPEPNPVFYASQDGGTWYKPELFGFDRGGSQILVGAELMGSWYLDKDGYWALGFITGVWPVEESLFIPVGLHARYTFNPKPVPYDGYCNSWNLFADVGIPIDFISGAPLFGKSFDVQRYFIDAGIGYDIAVCCEMDLTIDLGVRIMNLPLPQIDCCPDIPDTERNPFRRSGYPFLRFGITF